MAVDGRQVMAVQEAAQEAIERVRANEGPVFLHARCVHLEGHFLGYQLLRAVRDPLKEMPGITVPLTRSFLRFRGAPWRERMAGLKTVLSAVRATARGDRQEADNDPVAITRKALASAPDRLAGLEEAIEQEIAALVAAVLEEVPA